MRRLGLLSGKKILPIVLALLFIFGPAAEGAVYYSPVGYYTQRLFVSWPGWLYRFKLVTQPVSQHWPVPSTPQSQPTTVPSAQFQPIPAPKPSLIPAPKPTPTTPLSGSASYQLSLYEQRVVELVNAERLKAGLTPLQVDLDLSRVARLKAEDMRDKNYFSHNSPTYGSFIEMLRRFGIPYRTAGENIAAGYRSPEAVVAAWMASPGHKSNILNPTFTRLGVGYASGGSYGHYWVQLFIGR
ncbi:uncharacterized protein, YkwD family [Thermanaeromonas toyohensis ToBE]|uniref:Uncharacterized protein, YkwD family n=1 Tax=Thermanaeromonas toyohensis ToBE TaxID=698762 RepID=A0A1W1VJF0_9FIRM|nr:CAP domain-containing protein [Thermanaeromonas toyohensis]SMB93507.1 uncharacterized protein, YkwD family [Thermanaeromonas toyohensis ToBE]